MNTFTAIQYVTSGTTLAAFALAIALYAYRARLSRRREMIETVPAEDRTIAIQETAELLGVPLAGLSEKDKYRIVIAQIEIRARREWFVFLFLLIAGAASAAIFIGGIKQEQRPTVCNQFDPQTMQPIPQIERPCFPGEIAFVKYWDPSEYPAKWPNDRPNRVLQLVGDSQDGHRRWIEQDLVGLDGPAEKWGSENHFWVEVVDGIGVGRGMVETVIRRIELTGIPLGDGKSECDSGVGSRVRTC